MIGSLINAGSVILGGSIGLLIHRSLPERVVKIVFQGLGLFTIFFGFHLATKTNNYIVMIFSIVIGGIIGEFIDIEKYLNRFADYIKGKLKSKNDKFSEGFITSFLLFCIGPMTILGSLEEGIEGKPDILMVKSLMDGFSSIALASAMGIGVILSSIPLLIYQGILTLFASGLDTHINELIINELSAVGGIILIGLGINILEIKRIKIVNMLPALIIVIALSYLFLFSN